MARPIDLARRFYDRFEPIHGITYFAPEARAAADELGYRGFWRGYFATRSAPLGMVCPRLVEAAFYNFASFRVVKSLEGAWETVSPQQALSARQGGPQRLARGASPLRRVDRRALARRTPGDAVARRHPATRTAWRCPRRGPGRGGHRWP